MKKKRELKYLKSVLTEIQKIETNVNDRLEHLEDGVGKHIENLK